MKTAAVYGMIYGGSALMAYNIWAYVRFLRHVRKSGGWDHERRIFRLPILLLVLFLLGYLMVGIFGKPDLVISGILFGGSVFVFVMLYLIRRAFDTLQENEKLAARASAAEEASRAKTFFLSNMSHDIRTPLNAIIGYTTLAERAPAGSQEKDEYIRKIDAAGHQLLDIVNDVLEMSRIESGRVRLEVDRCDLEAVIREAEDLVRTQLTGRGIHFSVSVEICHRWVLCDKNQLNRALMNLLCNAGKFTGENGSVSLILRELGPAKLLPGEASDERNEPDQEGIGEPGSGGAGYGEAEREAEAPYAFTYEIRVRDTGIGMSEEFVEHLFTPFEREQTSTISRIQGTGLGMSITKNIIDLMGGTIEVITEKGKGTEFIITVDLPGTDPPPETEQKTREAESFEGRRLLLAEDNPINLEIAVLILSEAGFLVETAENGREAVEKVQSSAPGWYDAVLMDIQMPEMDGYEAARAIRALPDPALAGIPVIAMTANAFAEDVQAAEAAGMNAHIAKPIDIDVMMKTLKEVLGQGSFSQRGGHGDLDADEDQNDAAGN